MIRTSFARPLVVASLLVLTLSAVAFAGQAASAGVSLTDTSVIKAIDKANRVVTLKHEDGSIDDVVCGPEVQRFDALKVGDKVTFRYYESLVTAIQKPGAAPPSSVGGGIVRNEGKKPGGTLSRQLTVVVTVAKVDAAAKTLTVTTDGGDSITAVVDDAKSLAGVKAGDKVQITYTQALAISVDAPKK